MATTKPVSILVIGMDLTPELLALKEEGHEVIHMDSDAFDYGCGGYESVKDFDLIVGPKCWRISPEHMKFLPLAIKEARAAMPKRVKKK